MLANKMRLYKLFDIKKHLYNLHNQQKSLLVKETQKMMIVGKVFISNIVILNKLTYKNDHSENQLLNVSLAKPLIKILKISIN